MTFSNAQYDTYREIFKGKRLPLAFVDLEALDANVALVARAAQGSGKTIRLGTKSIRCVPLMQRILDYDLHYKGFLTYTAEETAFLADKGYDDFILAYPTVQPSDIQLLVELAVRGRRVAITVDCSEHLDVLSAAGVKAGVILEACLEVDMAFRPFRADAIHLGLRRSPIRTPQQALELIHQASSLKGVRITALMGYEGHIAGTSDAVPGAVLRNFLMRALKKASVRELSTRRQAVVAALRAAGVNFRIVNGGGSGSLASTMGDPSVTEITIGSGFYAPALFHHFAEVKYQPAAYFALQIVRQPRPGMITCQGGGYPASGTTDASKSPRPVLPPGMKLLPLEGAGEVQTPLILTQGCPAMALGDPVFFQHAKAGELCERFDHLYLVRPGVLGEKIVAVVPTYRGEGRNFL